MTVNLTEHEVDVIMLALIHLAPSIHLHIDHKGENLLTLDVVTKLLDQRKAQHGHQPGQTARRVGP